MTSPREIRLSLVLAIALLALPVAAVIYFKSRANDQEAMAANRIEIAELRAQIASQTQELSELHSKMEQVRDDLVFLKPTFTSSSGPTPPVVLAELNRRFSELAAQQSNLLAAAQRHPPREMVWEATEQRRQRVEAAIADLESRYTEQQKKVGDAQTEVDTLRTSLTVRRMKLLTNPERMTHVFRHIVPTSRRSKSATSCGGLRRFLRSN